MDISGVRHSINAQLLDALEQAGSPRDGEAPALAPQESVARAGDSGAAPVATDPGETLLALDPWSTTSSPRDLPPPSEAVPAQSAPEVLAEFVVGPAISAAASA